MTAPSIGFGRLKGPNVGGAGGVIPSHFEAFNPGELVVGASTVVIASGSWISLHPESIKAGFTVEGVSTLANAVRIEITRNGVVVFDWLNAMPVGPHTHYGPFVLHNQPAGSASWGMQARCDTGTFTIAPGQGRFFFARKVMP